MAKKSNPLTSINRMTKQDLIDLIKSRIPDINKKTKKELVNILKGKVPNIDKKNKKELIDIFKGITPEINNLNKKELIAILKDITPDINKKTKPKNVDTPKNKTPDVNKENKQEHVDPPEDQTPDDNEANNFKPHGIDLLNPYRNGLLGLMGGVTRDPNHITRQEVIDIIESKTKEIDDKKNEIVDYWEGKENEKGVREGGMKKTIEALRNDIEDLLPGATSATLASAYKEKADIHRKLAKKYSTSFLIVIGIIFFLLVNIIVSFSFLQDENGKILGVLPFFAYLPITMLGIWIASFFNNKQREERRLEEEYSHKEMITKVFKGYKTEVEKLSEGEDTKKLLLKLYENIIKSADYNPSRYIGKYDTQHPILSMFKRTQESNKNTTSKNIDITSETTNITNEIKKISPNNTNIK